MLLFDDNKGRLASMPGKTQKQNPVGCIEEGKRLIGNIREASREDKTGGVVV